MEDLTKKRIFVISGPSGVGKSTIIHELMKIFPDSTQVLNTTSRKKRAGETDLKDFRFFNFEEFVNKFERDEFVEAGQYTGNCYGTLFVDLEEAKSKSDLLFWILDVKGLKNIEEKVDGVTSIFIADDIENLTGRMAKREFDKATLDERLKQSRWEISQAEIYDFSITNREGKLDETVQEIARIIER